MRRIFLVVAVVSFASGGVAWAQAGCAGCPTTQVSGYLAPNFRMIDEGENNTANMGFGMAFNRFAFSGSLECGKIVKSVAWKVEADVSDPSGLKLQWAYVQPQLTDALSFRIGHFKKAYSRELLHPTAKLLTVDRTQASTFLTTLGYGNYSYGLEAMYNQEKFGVTAGAYSGPDASSKVDNQDPVIDFGARAVFKPLPALEIGANAMMVTLPGWFDGTSWAYCVNDGPYPDSTAFYQTNSGMAFGFDLDYQKEFTPTMGLWLQAEMGMGDSWTEGPKEPAAADTWQDYSWYGFMYYYVKALFMVTPEFGVHLGYCALDPNTESGNADNGYVGQNDTVSTITPGIVYKWCKATRTQFEVQMVTEQQGVDGAGQNVDDVTYTHFVLQQVMSW
jgi:hypothetical protein